MTMPAKGYMVYLLIDPRDMIPFYAGMTCRPYTRWVSHQRNGSSAFPRLSELKSLGLKCRVRLLGIGLTHADARVLEFNTIRRHRQSLLNRLYVGEARLPFFARNLN